MQILTNLDSTARASATCVGIKQKPQKSDNSFRPEIIVVIGQAQTGKDVTLNTPILASGDSDDAGVLFGFGSPLHRMAKKLFPKSDNGSKVDTYFMAVSAPKTGSSNVQKITITTEDGIKKSFDGYIKLRDLPFEAAADIAGKVATIYQNNIAVDPRNTDLNSFETSYIPFSLTKGMSASEAASEINDILTEEISLPFISTVEDNVITLTSKWIGSDSKFNIELVDNNNNSINPAEYGVSFKIETVTEAAGEGTISDEALDKLDENFGVTRVVSQYSTSNVLDILKEKFEALQNPLIAQFVVCYTSIEAPESKTVQGTWDIKKLINFGNLRSDDNVNVQIAGDFGNLKKLKYKQRNKLLLSGFSNLIRKSDGSYRLVDLVSFYHPTGKSNPVYRYDRNITVIANITYYFLNYFNNSDEWKSVILVGEDDITNNPAARKLSDVKAAVNMLIGQLGL